MFIKVLIWVKFKLKHQNKVSQYQATLDAKQKQDKLARYDSCQELLWIKLLLAARQQQQLQDIKATTKLVVIQESQQSEANC